MNRLLLLAAFLFLAACATTGPLSAPVVAGAAAMIGVFDQLLAGGVIDPVQHQTLAQGIAAIDLAAKGATTPAELTAATGGATAAVLAIIRAWRGKPNRSAAVATPPA